MQVGQLICPVPAFSTIGLAAVLGMVPDVLGSVSVVLVPATACGVSMTLPLVLPDKVRVPSVVPGTPNVGVAVN